MKNFIKKIKEIDKSTLCRTVVQILAYINQFIAVLGQSSFASSTVYQWISFIITTIITMITWWENNDITSFARLGTRVLDALEDGDITEEEILSLLEEKE